MDRVFATDWETARRTLVHVVHHSGGAWAPNTTTDMVGTGVLVGAKCALTAMHCLRGAGDALLAVEYGAEFPVWQSNTIVDVKPFQKTDLALVVVEDDWRPRAGYEVASAILSPSAPTSGTSADVYGHAPTIYRVEGLPDVKILLSGIVHVRLYVDSIDDEFIRCPGPLQQSMSGGPLFMANGALAGITKRSLVSPDHTHGFTQFVNLLTHAHQIREAIADVTSSA